MKIYSWNVNGIRSAWGKGLSSFILDETPDILCLQEIKANNDQLPETNYVVYSNHAQKPGYAGVAVFSREKAVRVDKKLGHKRFDEEGRFLQIEFDRLTLINVYIPHGGRKKENLKYKLEVYDLLVKRLEQIKDKPVVLVGDFNIAHDERDLARPSSNLNNIMFTKEERQQLDRIESLGFVDTFRLSHKDNGHYSWFPYAFDARNRNLGWRIDYCFLSKRMGKGLKSSFILGGITGSDHVPVGIEVDI